MSGETKRPSLIQRLRKPLPFGPPIPGEPEHIFVHINKTGGTSIGWLLDRTGGHRSARDIVRRIGPAAWARAFTFTVVRNPWDRVVSHYHYRVQTNQTGLGAGDVPFRDWVRLTYGTQDPRFYDKPRMFQPQMQWICLKPGRIAVDKVLRFENLTEDFETVRHRLGVDDPLPHAKSSSREAYPVYYDAETREIVARWFAEDIAAFGYRFDDHPMARRPPGPRPRAYVINRAVDTDRLAQFRRIAGDRLDPVVIEAVDGHAPEFSLDAHADSLRNGWFGRRRVKPGAFACFLSHIEAWRRIAEGDAPWAFVFEDDAVLDGDLSAAAQAAGVADIVFVNARLAAWTEGVETPVRAAFRGQVAKALADGVAAFTAPGGDGYALTRTAAQRLLDHVAAHGVPGGVDYFLVGACLTPEDLPAPTDEMEGYKPLALYRRLASESPLDGRILSPPLCSTKGQSIIDHSVQARVQGVRPKRARRKARQARSVG